MKIVNPFYQLTDNNIFKIRQQEYDNILEKVQDIIQPVTEIDFEIVECCFKESRYYSGELHRTLKKNLVLRFQKGNHKIDLSMQIPKLIDKNYFIINGKKKIPLFQLFDIPTVTRGRIKIQTNVANMTLTKRKATETTEPYLHLIFLKKKIPLYLILIGYFGWEEIKRRFDLDNAPLPMEPTSLKHQMLYDLKMFYDNNSRGVSEDDVIKEIGSYFSKQNMTSKGQDLIYALDLIPKVDIMTSQFLPTGCILEELLNLIDIQTIDDLDVRNKRIRCFEYIVLSHVSKAIFDFCLTNRTARSPKFNINSTKILSECNVSDIVQFDFSINPIEELTKLSRTSLVGPGGFNKKNVPPHLRDMNETMFGRICPIDTPDRDNCGVLQNIMPNSIFDDRLKFTDTILEKTPISIPVSMVPFLEHDDQTRLQMASSQMRQAVMLQKFDKPLIQSGCEGLYTNQTQFIKIAKQDGDVVYLDEKYLIVLYDDGTPEIFDVGYRKIYTSNIDVLKILVKQGDKVKAGDILAESNYCSNGEINIGRRLLTAVMPYYGNNYEDGIVISDRIQKERVFTSVHFEDLSFNLPPNKVLLSLDENEYNPLPKIKETIQKGSVYAIIQEIPSNQPDYQNIFELNKKLITKTNILVTEVNLYANQWNKEIPEYDEWIQKTLEEQKEKEEKLKVIIKEFLPKEQAQEFMRDNGLDTYSNVGKFKEKGEEISGIRVELCGIYFRPIQIGDKIGNRHGNKGVIANIVEHEKMPQLEDGSHVDMCINPLGIISRINIGQLFELQLGMGIMMLKKILRHFVDNDVDQLKIKNYFYGFIKICDKTEDEWYGKQIYDYLCNNDIDYEFIDNFSLIQPPFESVDLISVIEALNYVKTPFKYKLFDPVSKMHILNEVAVGYSYFFKMVHIAETRLAARGIASYSKKTLQPLGGRKNKGGQRLGEMETTCFIGHDATVNLSEFLTTKSDCIDLKNQYIREQLDSEFVKERGEVSIVPESVELFNAYLTVIGLKR